MTKYIDTIITIISYVAMIIIFFGCASSTPPACTVAMANTPAASPVAYPEPSASPEPERDKDRPFHRADRGTDGCPVVGRL